MLTHSKLLFVGGDSVNLLTQKQIQDKYKVTRQCIYKWRKLFQMPYSEFNTVLMFDEKAVEEWYDKYKRGLLSK